MQFFARKFGSFFAFVQRWQTCTVFTLMGLPSYFLTFSPPPLVPIPRLGNWETDVSLWARMAQGQQFLKSGPETWNMHVGRPAIFRDELQACNYIKQTKETVQIIEASWTERRIRSKSQNYTWICQSCSNLESLNCIGHPLPKLSSSSTSTTVITAAGEQVEAKATMDLTTQLWEISWEGFHKALVALMEFLLSLCCLCCKSCYSSHLASPRCPWLQLWLYQVACADEIACTWLPLWLYPVSCADQIAVQATSTFDVLPCMCSWIDCTLRW